VTSSPTHPNLALMPARRLPLVYFAFAHVCLATAFATLAIDSRELLGFFYGPRMVAVVHLVTLGWISASILGSLYVIGPLAFRMPLPAGRLDGVAFGAFVVGVLGMVSHFWLNHLVGMAWSGGLVALAFVYVSGRVLRRLPSAPVGLEAKLPLGLALINGVLAAAAGIVLGVNKADPFLPLPQLATVFGHAHLAAVGWGTMMVIGAGYRLIPMLLPAAMPKGRWPLAAAILTEAGVLGLFAGFLTESPLLGPFAVVTAAGLAVFAGQIAWMLRRLRPAPAERPRPDWTVAHALQAFVYLTLTTVGGVLLAFLPRSEATFRVATVYGVFGLVGFLSQIVVGVEGRILPLFTWLWGFADTGYRQGPPSLHRAPVHGLQAVVFFLWTLGVPLLALGLFLESRPVVVPAALLLLLGVVLAVANAVTVLRRLRAPRPSPP
jgi:hypothetical protein